MNKILYAFVIIATLTSCAESYSVQGSSSISALDGSKLYLKAIKDNELRNIDSCDVVHGKFRFAGLLDTVCMANLFMDDEGIMPVVLEQGEISIRIDKATQTVYGTPLNDKLYEFIDLHNQLANERAELTHKHSQMLLEGIDEDYINQTLMTEAAIIDQREDSLVTHFIIDNFDNVLGPGVFMMITANLRYPILTPQIEEIMSKATQKFKNDPYVKDYYQTATENQARQLDMMPSEDNAPQPGPPALADMPANTETPAPQAPPTTQP